MNISCAQRCCQLPLHCAVSKVDKSNLFKKLSCHYFDTFGCEQRHLQVNFRHTQKNKNLSPPPFRKKKQLSTSRNMNIGLFFTVKSTLCSQVVTLWSLGHALKELKKKLLCSPTPPPPSFFLPPGRFSLKPSWSSVSPSFNCLSCSLRHPLTFSLSARFAPETAPDGPAKSFSSHPSSCLLQLAAKWQVLLSALLPFRHFFLSLCEEPTPDSCCCCCCQKLMDFSGRCHQNMITRLICVFHWG